MNERIRNREDRKGRFGDCRVVPAMDSCQLGRRDLSQCERLFIRCMESVHTALLSKEKERSES